ncbi:WD40 repeat-like protein [Xylaria sp. CBS 124048]|nr:WD40 repeat-like protein [Xylaria sp. CBS 124048]
MATQRLSNPSTTTQEIIDLTDDNNNNNNNVDGFRFPLLHLPVLPARSIHTLESRPLPATPSRDNKASIQNGRVPQPSRQPDRVEGQTRPAKRRRIIIELASPEPGVQDHDDHDQDDHEQRRQDVAAALGKCLEEQVFPHIERATETLPADTYDLDRLGAKVIRSIVDQDFERHYNQGGGRLSAAKEQSIAAGVRRLVTQLASGPAYRLPTAPDFEYAPPLAPRPIPSSTASPLPQIIPSIEDSERDRSRVRTKPARTAPEPRAKRKQVSLSQLRTKPKVGQWQSGKSAASVVKPPTKHRSFGLQARPYTLAQVRQQIISGVENAVLPAQAQDLPSQVFHVDFSYAEMDYLRTLARKLYGKPAVDGTRSTLRDLRNVLKKVPNMKSRLVKIHSDGYTGYDPPPASLSQRSPIDISNFLNDLYNRRLNAIPATLFIEHADPVVQREAMRVHQIPSLLLSREISGGRLGSTRTYQNFINAVKNHREDYLEPQVEWTNCAGDIMTVSWLSDTDFVCGTTTHSDSHNQQYNKAGNLLLGSAVSNVLQAYPDHRIVRPVVTSGDNSLDSMVASQDPWLYTSVVSSDYDPLSGLAFTSSFDNTVKIWTLQNGSMTALGTWNHEGRVNFVVSSKNSSGTVATAADVTTKAVRVYHLDQFNISGSQYDSYSCTRVDDEDYVASDKWAYYPAAIRWGRAPSVQHLLLIGYSPRSTTGDPDADDIPEDKLDTGELCLWDTITKMQIKVNSAKTQNVFEVAWHPTNASFAACTSATLPVALENTDQYTRTQVRIFSMNKDTGQYVAIKTLDCPAIDINELSIMPNSLLYSYVAASCTNGNVYVWDTAGSDWPMCVLEHGAPVEELLGEREREDVGVKFTAWATTADRLYTGSSDGVVKVWNIRHGSGTLVRDLMEAAAPITCGEFSPDFTKLVVGDASGRVYLIGLEEPNDEEEDDDEHLRPNPTVNSPGFLDVKTSSGSRAIRRPRPFLPHPEPPPPGAPAHVEPSSDELMEGQRQAIQFLNSAQLQLHPDPTVGVVQGRNYMQTGLFRREAHYDEDPYEPLLAPFENMQQSSQRLLRGSDYRMSRLPRQKGPEEESSLTDTENWYEAPEEFYPHHQLEEDDEGDNGGSDDLTSILDPATLLELRNERAELDDRLIDLDYETSVVDSDEER